MNQIELTIVESTFSDLAECIKDINCQGSLVRDQDINNGIFARGVFIQRRDPDGKKSVVVGKNPGRAESEKKQLSGLSNFRAAYEKWLTFQQLNEGQKPYMYYYAPICVLDALGYSGDILWTEFYRCEHQTENRGIDSEAGKYCTDKYLLREIESFVKPADDFVVLAQCWEAFEYLQSAKWRAKIPKLLGMPHPTGTGGLINYLFEDKKSGAIQKRYVDEFQCINDIQVSRWVSIHRNK